MKKQTKVIGIGSVIKHTSGRKVKLIEGSLYRNGRVSNWWRFQEVFPDGSLGKIEGDYRWW